MNKDFSRNITLLRKERKLSQKQAAADLGISQALLSHYEKGIRECSLDFVCKVSEYYDVSCDYLLGRTAQRYHDIAKEGEDTAASRFSASQLINKRLITNSLNVLYDLMIRIGNRKLSVSVSNYFMLGIYQIFRRIYTANEKNPMDMFSASEAFYRNYADISQELLLTEIDTATTKNHSESYIKALDGLEIDPLKLAEEYPESASSLFNVLQHAETKLDKIKTIQHNS